MSLEKPPFLLLNGEVVPWSKGLVHLWSETAIRATNVFEGIRAYWNAEHGDWHLVAWKQHIKRFQASAKLMRIPYALSASDLLDGIQRLLSSLPYRQDMYVRPTIYVEEGLYSAKAAEMKIGMYVVAFPVDRPQRLQSIRCMVSSWTRASDLAGMPRAKSGAIYFNVRLPRIEAADRGFDDAIMLNERGKVAEVTGACIFIVREGRVCTPLMTDSILEGITRHILIKIAQELGYPVEERSIDRTELYIADEAFCAGTLSEIAAISSIDGVTIGNGGVGEMTMTLASMYKSWVHDRSGGLVHLVRPV